MPAKTYDVAVVGAGSFGAWTAWHLRRAGQSVLLVDAWAPGHSRASSGGESRLIRMSYGADDVYTRMAKRSLDLWKQVAPELFFPTGVLMMGRRDDPHSEASVCALGKWGIPAEILGPAELAKRYPQMRPTEPHTFGILETESGAVLARRAVAAVLDAAVRDGVSYETRAVAPGERLDAGITIFACGPWLPKLFPDLLSDRIFPTRQEVFFFAPPPGDPRFAPGVLPAWVDFCDPRGPYGFPDLEGRGVKFCFDRHGEAFDPDTRDRAVTAAGVDEARQFLGELFPALRNAPLTESRVCQYENTSNGDFLIDRHPESDRIWIAGGGSGHGFKHGPAVGEYLAERILHGALAEPRFSLASKLSTQGRTVY